MALSGSVYKGTVNVRWGLGASCVTITGATGQFQSVDLEEKLDELEVRDCRGTVTAWIGYNPVGSATIEYVVSAAGTIDGSAAITKPDQGAIVTIGTAVGDPLSGSNWIVQSTSQKESNTDVVKVTVKAIRYLNITS